MHSLFLKTSIKEAAQNLLAACRFVQALASGFALLRIWALQSVVVVNRSAHLRNNIPGQTDMPGECAESSVGG